MVQILSSSSSSSWSPSQAVFNQNPRSSPSSSCLLHQPLSYYKAANSRFNLSGNKLEASQNNCKQLFSVNCRQSEYFEQSSPSERFSSSVLRDSSAYPSSFPPSAPGSSPKVFVGHSIYKGKAAVTVEPKAPEFTTLESGAFRIYREGCVLLQFAPAAGVRQYDWTRKQMFSLSVPEIGSLISLGAKESCEFFHDPNKGRSDEGKVRKVLKVDPFPDGSGHFFNLSVQNKLLNIDENIYMPITKAEFAVLVSAFNYILPYLLGWSTFAESIRPEDPRSSNSANPRMGDYEWSR